MTLIDRFRLIYISPKQPDGASAAGVTGRNGRTEQPDGVRIAARAGRNSRTERPDGAADLSGTDDSAEKDEKAGRWTNGGRTVAGRWPDGDRTETGRWTNDT